MDLTHSAPVDFRCINSLSVNLMYSLELSVGVLNRPVALYRKASVPYSVQCVDEQQRSCSRSGIVLR